MRCELPTLLAAALLLVAGVRAEMPPAAKAVPFSETLHGETVSDPYRWMEGNDPDYAPWLRQQEAFARSWLAALPGRSEVLKGIEMRSGAAARMADLQVKGSKYFFARRAKGAQQYSLYVRSSDKGSERLLLDPSSLDTQKSGSHAINYWEASPDGRYVYLGVSSGGSELSTLRVLEVSSGKLLPESVPMAMFNYNPVEFLGGLYPQWLPDSSGFFYNRLADGATPGTPDFFLNTKLFLHRVGTDAKSDTLIAEAGTRSAFGLSPVAAPFGVAQPGSRFALMVIVYGVQRAIDIYVAPVEQVKSPGAWRRIVEARDQVEGVALAGDDIYLLVRDRSRGRVVRLGAATGTLSSSVAVVPEGDAVLDRVIAARDGIYLTERAATGTRVRRLGFDGSVAAAKLPFDGISYFQFGSPSTDGLYVSLENNVVPRGRFHVSGESSVDLSLESKPSFSTDAYVSETVMVTVRDGVKVPLDLVRRRDVARDAKRPVLLEAYGAYGINIDPAFDPRLFALLDAGAIYAAAHVRGGGELGNDWWKAGFQATKPNTWRDAIDCAQWLIEQGWTERGKITLWGTSAGGIMVGRAITERPELWAGGVASVGLMNASRFEFTSNGETNVPEFGSIKTPEGFRALMAMDAYQAVRDGVVYPPMLITAGMNDQRVTSWQPAKFAARLQSATRGGPVIFKVDVDQGHGIGSQRSQVDNDAADVAAFTLWAAGQARR